MSDFKPSDIDLGRVGFPPLVATFEKTECEIAATLMLRAMDDEWCGVEWVEVQTLAKADLAACKLARTLSGSRRPCSGSSAPS